jgi:dCMP deaminase
MKKKTISHRRHSTVKDSVDVRKNFVSRRPSWDEYFLEMSALVAKRSTCLRRSVGAVIVKEKRILATGYNGAPSGLKHCVEIGCIRQQLKIPSGERHELCRALHAEQNALIQACLHGISVKGATLYATTQPCVICAKMLINAGIKEIVIAGGYPDKMALSFLKQAKIKIRKI